MKGRFSMLETGRLSPGEIADAPPGTTVRGGAFHLETAHKEERLGRYERALSAYTRCLKDDRASVPAWTGQVRMLVQLREYDEGILWAEKALELMKNNGDLLAAKAQSALRAGDRTLAIASSDASVAAAGSSSWRWQVRGEVLLQKAPARSGDCFRRALTEPGADWFDRVMIARTLLFHGRPGAALEFAQQAAGAGVHPAAWVTLAMAQEGCGFAGPAAESAARALELAPGNEEAAALKARLAKVSGGATVWRRLTRWVRG